ncbi:hypothetical protein SAY87_013826 [Trapa incisa]|uniref:F-box domain-containing protein n=2 Tax=Trapa TaxID=22665 RepID=A0AAN7KCR9_TRANT|nr:hypothetical protein SAY86_008367 [Trapa natans]KAK4764388.1 hypothetical protein SAY87_013826 [Trapa incisa]
MESYDSIEWVPNLPVDLGLECLTRLPYSAHGAASGVCRNWRELLRSPGFYLHRRRMGYTRKVACLVQAFSPQNLSGEGSKPHGSPSYAPGRCPRSSAGVSKDGRLVSWSESNTEVRVGVCGVSLGEFTLLTESEYQGAQQGFYTLGGQNGKLTKISVPEEFSGLVQSGCCVEI